METGTRNAVAGVAVESLSPSLGGSIEGRIYHKAQGAPGHERGAKIDHTECIPEHGWRSFGFRLTNESSGLRCLFYFWAC